MCEICALPGKLSRSQFTQTVFHRPNPDFWATFDRPRPADQSAGAGPDPFPLILNEAVPGLERRYRDVIFCSHTSYTIDRICKIYFTAQMWCYDITPIPQYDAFTPQWLETARDEDHTPPRGSWFSVHSQITDLKTNCSRKFHENMRVIDMSMPLHSIDSTFSEPNGHWFSNYMNQLKKVWMMLSISDRDNSLQILCLSAELASCLLSHGEM
jgi:hypothetical protein